MRGERDIYVGFYFLVEVGWGVVVEAALASLNKKMKTPNNLTLVIGVLSADTITTSSSVESRRA